MSSTILKFINYHLVPPVFLVIFTLFAQILAQVGNPTSSFEYSFIFGNLFAWKVVSSVVLWAFIWLWIPSKKFYGPPTNFGFVPIYQANGELYYFASVLTFGFVAYLKPRICLSIYENLGPILGVLNIIAFTLCAFLLIKAKLKRDEKDPYLLSQKFPLAHEFYRGMELHPRILGVDVKQLTNCRVGLMLWQWLILVSFGASYELHHQSIDAGLLSSVLLQSIYLYKFYRWETGYFNTLDITLDRAGYYICWGCLVWVPSLYTFPSYYLVHHQTNCSEFLALLIIVLGIGSIYYNYDVDRQKELFRTKNGVNCSIWGKPAQAVEVSYRLPTGEKKETQLLVSGWWGIARKINYTFELAAAFCWSSSAGFQYGVWPFSYFLFLMALLVHRVFRDEEKCKAKYGAGWEAYCKKVPYRLVPYLF